MKKDSCLSLSAFMTKSKMNAVALTGLLLMLPVNVYAGDDSLTSLFRSQAFSGSMETISKLNWVGWLLSGIISVFCLIGLFLTIFRIITSLMYLSGRNVFDKIHDIKSSNQGEFFGLKSLVSNTIHGNGDTGSGVDTFVYFIFGLLPDVKMYSDFADGKELKGVGPDTTATEYVLKVSIPTIMMIFFLSIGFSGVLWQMYGTVVDAMSVAAERVANTNLEASVKRLLNADSYYQFGFSSDGTKWGAKEEAIAKSIYNKVLAHSDETINGDNALLLGKAISQYFLKDAPLNRNTIAKVIGVDTSNGLSDSEAKNLDYEVKINSVSDKLSTGTTDVSTGTIDQNSVTNEVVISMKDLLTKMKGIQESDKDYKGEKVEVSDIPLYIHVFVYRRESAIQGNYFSSKEKKANSKVKGNTSGHGSFDNPIGNTDSKH